MEGETTKVVVVAGGITQFNRSPSLQISHCIARKSIRIGRDVEQESERDREWRGWLIKYIMPA